jgi:hypothetical protein
MNGAQVLQAAIIGNAPTAWTIAATGDFNGDGKSDILWRDTGGNVTMWFLNGAQVSSAAGVGNVSTVWSIQESMPTDAAVDDCRSDRALCFEINFSLRQGQDG